MTIQLDFGGFNTAFIGVTLRYSNKEAWDFWRSFTGGNQPVSLSHLSMERRFEALSVATVVNHEIRHFHDFLLSSYQAHLFKFRIENLINTIQVLVYLQRKSANLNRKPANCLPIPIQKWCQLDEEERKECLKWLPLRADGGEWIPFELPYLCEPPCKPSDGIYRVPGGSNDVLATMVQADIISREKIRSILHNPTTVSDIYSFQPWQVFELSGLLVQIQDVWTTFGVDDTELFCDKLCVEIDNPYSALLKLILQKESPLSDRNFASAATTWSMFGSYNRDGLNACPAHRFLLLFDGLHKKESHLYKKSMQYWMSGDLIGLFKEWSSQLGVSTVEDGLIDAQKTYRRTAELIDQHYEQYSTSLVAPEHYALIRRMTQFVALSNTYMCQKFWKNPEAYVIPYQYITGGIGELVGPLVRNIYDNGIEMPINVIKRLEEEGHEVSWQQLEHDRALLCRLATQFKFNNEPISSARDICDLETLFDIRDYFFEGTNRDYSNSGHISERVFSNTGLMPFEVFD